MDWLDQFNALVEELDRAKRAAAQAYQFNAGSYTHSAHLACMKALEQANDIALIVRE